MKRLAAALAAAGVLVAGAFAASFVSSAAALAQTDTNTESTVERPGREAALDEVLADLVTAGTINQDQADAVKAALVAKSDERRADREERFAQRQADRELMAGFLEDGELDADELAQLSDDHPLTDPEGPAAAYLEDGRLSEEELRELHSERGRAGHRGSHAGPRKAIGTDA